MRGVRKVADIRERCAIDSETGCWIWKGAYSAGDRSETPVVWSAEAKRVISVTRLFAFLDSGNQAYIERGSSKLKAWRTCLNPKCVKHVGYGTVEEWGKWTARNGQRKGKANVISANTRTRRAASCINLDDARSIRQSTETGTALAKTYGLSETQISRIRRNICWRDTMPAASVFSWLGGNGKIAA